MAKLTRVTQPIFASDAAVNETSVFGTMKTSAQYTANIADSINTVAFTKGWSDAVELDYAPYMEDMNTVQRAITYQIAYNQQEGIPEWASDTTYFKGSWAKYNATNGAQIYESLVDNNVGNLVSDNTKWKLVLDTANGYVTTNTAQTITGAKTFSSQIIASAGNGIQIKGTNHNYVLRSGGSPYEGCSLLLDNDLTKKAFSADASKMTIGSSAIPAYANVPSGVTTSTSNEQIATTGWVNTVGNNVVHRSGNETIFGTKTFTSSPVVSMNMPVMALQSTTAVKGTTPSSTIDEVVAFFDKNGTAQSNKLGQVFCSYTGGTGTVAGSIHVGLGVFKPQSGSTVTDYLSIYYPVSGSPYATAPASDVNGSILTTVNKSKSANGYFKLGNGMIIQWGRTTDTTNQTKTITFPVAFTSTNYSITATANNQYSSYSYDGVTGISDKTTTGCKVYSYYASRTYDWIAIGY